MASHLRLIADDLTGALDTAAQFTGLTGPLPVFWRSATPESLPPNAAIDAGTREQDAACAGEAIARLAPLLAPESGRISYLKLDSLLRGHAAGEIAACLAAVPFRYCIIAPAFPFQSRVTRGGLQYVLARRAAARVGPDLAAALGDAGIGVRNGRPGEAVPEGTSLWDAETDADLRCIVSAGLALSAPTLWCGSAGLAAALAGLPPISLAPRALPLLGILGSDHAVTVAQLRAAGPHHVSIGDGSAENANAVRARLAANGVALVSFRLPAGLERAEAACRIGSETDRLLGMLPRPGMLVVAGGETLRAVSTALGAGHLEVEGQIMPGVPVSRLRGGRWDSVAVVSKSGAFGEERLLAEIVAGAVGPC